MSISAMNGIENYKCKIVFVSMIEKKRYDHHGKAQDYETKLWTATSERLWWPENIDNG